MTNDGKQDFNKDNKRIYSFEDLYAKNINNIVELDVEFENKNGKKSGSSGTGIIINGYVLTNKHVVFGDDIIMLA